MRNLPVIQKLKEYISEGYCGTIKTLDIKISTNWSAEIQDDYLAKFPQERKNTSLQILMKMLQVHVLDLVSFIDPSPITKIFSSTSLSMSSVDMVTIQFTTESGTIGRIQITLVDGKLYFLKFFIV